MKRIKEYAPLVIGVIVLYSLLDVLRTQRIINPGHPGTVLGGLLWLLCGLLWIVDKNPMTTEWDRWERKAYGQVSTVTGILWLVIGMLPWSATVFENKLVYIPLLFLPPLVMVIVAHQRYVKPMRKKHGVEEKEQ